MAFLVEILRSNKRLLRPNPTGEFFTAEFKTFNEANGDSVGIGELFGE